MNRPPRPFSVPPTPRCHPFRHRLRFETMSGQGLTEFLVLCLALIPLFLLTPMIAKYQDIVHATRMASRYAAFDAMTRNASMSTWKLEAQLAAEVRRRFFGNPDAPIKTGDTAGDFAAHQNMFWRDPAGGALIRNFGTDIKVSFGTAASASQADGFRAASDGMPFNVPLLNIANHLGLASDGIHTTNIDVTVAKLPQGLRYLQPFDTLDLSIRRHTSVVVDPWTANGPEQVEDRIDKTKLFPARTLRPLAEVIGASVTVFELGQVSKPHLADLPLWRDVVPTDRLRPH